MTATATEQFTIEQAEAELRTLGYAFVAPFRIKGGGGLWGGGVWEHPDGTVGRIRAYRSLPAEVGAVASVATADRYVLATPQPNPTEVPLLPRPTVDTGACRECGVVHGHDPHCTQTH